MATGSSIEWTEATWNPLTGCTKVSPGCKHCYAERMAKRLQGMNHPSYTNGFRLTLHEHLLDLPMQWKKPKTKRVNLEKSGIKRGKAYERSNSSKGYCRIAHSPVLCRTLNNAYFARLQYVGFTNYYFWKTEHQAKLF